MFVVCVRSEYRSVIAVHRILYIGIGELRPHEEIKEKKLSGFVKFASRVQKSIRLQPIWIDRDTKVILDGHHRYSVYKELGCMRVPCIAVDYLRDSSISVLPRKPDIPVSKESVIERGFSGKPYPPKTTKHVFPEPAPFLWVNLKKCRE